MTAPLDIDHPWPGLDSFRTQDAPFFRGREREIEQLLRLVHRAQLVVLYGASGLGKTSLINAGLIPRLPPGELFAVPMRVSYVAGAPSVSDQIQCEIIKCRGGAGTPKPRPDRTAWEFLHLRDEPIEGPQPLLIFDQFEELFTIGAGTPQAAQLIEELRALIEGIPPTSVRERLKQRPEEARSLSFQQQDHRVLLSLREDYLYGLDSLRTQLPSLIHNRFRIGPLSGVMALEVVLQRPAAEQEGAARPSGAPLGEPDVAELIVRTVASSAGGDRPLEMLEVEPALLSIMCAELALRREPGQPITREFVTGSRADIISSFYERALDGVPDTVRTYIEDELVTAMGFRTSTVLAEALTVRAFTNEVLSDLVNKRLVRVIERPNGKWLELTHDILTEIAAGSRRRRQERQRTEQERRERAEQERAAQLARAARERRVRTRVVMILCGLLATIVMLASVYVLESHSRREATEHAEEERRLRKAADEAKHVLRRQFINVSSPREALAHLAAVLKEEPDTDWAPALTGDLLMRRTWPLPATPMFPKGPFTALSCNKRRTRCAAAYRDGSVLVSGDLTRKLTTNQTGYGDLFMSANGEHLVFFPEQPGTVIQWALGPTNTDEAHFPVGEIRNDWWSSSDAQTVVLPKGRELIIWYPSRPAPSYKSIQRDLSNAPFHLSRDGKWLAYQRNLKTITLTTAEGDESHDFPVSGKVTIVRIDPSSKELFAAVADGTLRRWSIPERRELSQFMVGRRIDLMGFNSAGGQMVLGLEDGSVQLWAAPWRSGRVLMSSSRGVMNFSFAPDDRWLAIATRDGEVSAWSSAGAPLGEPVHLVGLAFTVALEGQGLLSVSLAEASARWIVPAPRAPQRYQLGEDAWYAWFLAEDTFYAYGLSKGILQVGAESTIEKPVYRSPLHISRDRHHAASLYTNGLYLREGMPSQWDPDGHDKLLSKVGMENARFSVDGKRLVAWGAGKGYLFDVLNGWALGEPIDKVNDGWLNNDGTILATTGPDVGLKLWRCANDGSLSELEHIDTLVVSGVAFNTASDALVLATEHEARVFSLRDRRFIGHTLAHGGFITDVAFSPDGRWIVTASVDSRARIWEAATGLPASDWFVHDGSVRVAAFSPSGRKLLTASGSDGLLKVWDLATIFDITEEERRWLAHLAEIVSGLRIDPQTNEAVPVPRAAEALEAFRREVGQACPGASTDPPRCASATTRLIQTVLGERRVGASQMTSQ